MKSLPQAKHFSHAFVLLSLFALASGCNEDPSFVEATTQFTQTSLIVAENEGEQTISFKLDNPAPADGEITVRINAITPTCYSTFPVADFDLVKINVKKGDTRKSFKMTPTDNDDLDGTKAVKFTISSLTEGLIAGASKELLVSVIDDESPAPAGFEMVDHKVRENDISATKVSILFPYAAPADGVLVVQLQSSNGTYGVHYATQPQAVSGKIFLQVPKGATSVVFNLHSVNDNVLRADRVIKFTLYDASGGIKIGANDLFTCTITDDDGQQLTPIATLRSMYDGSPVIIKEDTYIQGVVTSVSNTLAGRVVIEDGTGGLPIQFLSGQMPTRGDVIFFNIRNAQVKTLQGTLEVGVVAGYEKIGEEEIRVDRISLPDLLGSTKRMESRTVQLNNIVFTQANGTTKLGGDRIVTDGTRTIIVRTGSGADFGDNVIPMGAVLITGIFTNCDGLYVLYPQELKDIKRQSPTQIVREGLTLKPH